MSASISCSERARALLDRVLGGDEPDPGGVRAIGDECAGEFFHIVVESLADSFDPRQTNIYETLMRAWIPPAPQTIPAIPERVETVYVLSRVTLGADIKIVSPILMAMRRRFPDARIVFAGNRKSAALFEDKRWLEFFEADYPRGGSMRDRIAFAERLRERLNTRRRIVIDPDSRMSQLGLIPVCEPERYFHFPSRGIGGESNANLTGLAQEWLRGMFGVSGIAWIEPKRMEMDATRPVAAISLGVGENESKRLGIEFERRVIGEIAKRFRTVFVDRGVGGAEAARVTEAAQGSGAVNLRFWEGSFAGFASIISQSDFYAGYDSAGQHAAAASGTPLVTIFRGAPSARFRERWAPAANYAHIIDADSLTPAECLDDLITILSGHS